MLALVLLSKKNLTLNSCNIGLVAQQSDTVIGMGMAVTVTVQTPIRDSRGY